MSLRECARCASKEDLVTTRDYVMPLTWCGTCAQLDPRGFALLVEQVGRPIDRETCAFCGAAVARDMQDDGRAACVTCGREVDAAPAPAGGTLEGIDRGEGHALLRRSWLRRTFPLTPLGWTFVTLLLLALLVASCRAALGLHR